MQAARGKLGDCFARLDACGAEPELIALCKKCLAFEPEERPHNAGAVAQAVAGLRSAAEERARRAERDQAAAAARSAERRKRRRLWLGAAAVLAVAVVCGLTAVVVVQRRANAELEAEQAKVQARFEMAVKAIETFHTGVSEDALLKNPQFKELRTKLLKEAAVFYADLEKLLAGQTDAKSRKTLAEGYFQLAELTDKIGDRKQALEVHRKALSVRRELASARGADVETQLDVARSLWKLGWLLRRMSNAAEARAASEEQRDLAERLEALEPTDEVRAVLAHAHHNIGGVLSMTARFREALDSYRKALAIYQELADANPGNQQFRYLLASTYINIGYMLTQTDKSADGLEALRKASGIMQKLADTNPANTGYQEFLANSYDRIAVTLLNMGKPAEAMEAERKASAIFQKLFKDNGAVTDFQYRLAQIYDGTGWDLLNMGKPAEGMLESRKASAIMQKLADENPAIAQFQFQLANIQNNIGRALDRQKRLAEAFQVLDASLAINEKLAEAEPNNARYSRALGESHGNRGGVRARAGQPAEAAADLRRALELWAKVPRLDIEMQVERSRALSLLAGLGADAKSGVTKKETKAFADQAVAALADAIKTG